MERRTLCLNGEWDFMPVYGVKACLGLPETLTFDSEKIRVPSSWRYMSVDEGETFGKVDSFEPFNLFDYPKEWSEADTGVYRATFRVPDDMLGGRLFLRFDGIMHMSRVYLNGEAIVDWEEAYLPLKVDISHKVQGEGKENELMVVCTTFEEVEIPSGEIKSLGLLGSWFGKIGRGIWQDVFLENCPATHIEDAFVRTSVRKSSISVTVDVDNKSTCARDIAVGISIIDNGTTVKSFAWANINLEAGTKQSISLEEKWTEAISWTSDDPHLYYLKIDLLEKNEVIDTKTIRFGFREIWIEGDKFILNGTRINLRGDSWHFQGAIQQTKEYALNWFKMCKEKGLNFVRLHAEPYPEVYLEAADEVGMLIVDETAIYGSSKAMPADHPVYIERCRKHVERLVLRDRNHPSVIVWSLQNEMRWVDGRDIYKLHIPELMEIIRRFDGTRSIIIEGDNRLLPKEKCDIESYHYNIDGTIGQWDKKRPLVFGEHGGWWYICPQNSSAYIGLKAYEDNDYSVQGFALKEKLYVEYARMSEVSGITSFNFAHYMMKSMPDEDIYLSWDRLDTPGCKPRLIPKHSLTINNGYLKNYPEFKPNPAMSILESCYKTVTIIPSEYDTAFFDGGEIVRNFYVYNDSLQRHESRVDVSISLDNGVAIYRETFEFAQEPGEKKNIEVSFTSPRVMEKETIHLEAVLYHDSMEKHRLTKTYTVFPYSIKQSPLDDWGRRSAFFGNARDFQIIKRLLPGIERADDIGDIASGGFQVFILGSYLKDSAEKYQGILGDFTSKGGILVQLEQFKFVPVDLLLVKQPFFSAHMSDAGHEILKDLSDEDLIFWKPHIREETPEDIIKQSFIKPVHGDIKMILECSTGDFGDGGDLWTPMLELGNKEGTAIFNQLEIMDNYENVPQACVLLRNILNYAFSLKSGPKSRTGVLAEEDGNTHRLALGIDLEFDLINEEYDFSCYRNIICDISKVSDRALHKLSEYVKNGGHLVIPAVNRNDAYKLEWIVETQVQVIGIPTYHLNKTCVCELLAGVSLVDLFRFEKVPCSPRLVENKPICENAIEMGGAAKLLENVTGTAWFDYFVGWKKEEYSRIALVDINRKNTAERKPYLIEKRLGNGSVIVSQISADTSNEKNIRVYARLLANMGAYIDNSAFSYVKSHKDYSIDYMMTLPHRECNDYDTALEYFTDRDYSLNNLGEGLYGWMKKIEKDPRDGFINIIDSKGKRYFLACFVDYIEDKSSEEPQPDTLECMLDMDANCSFKLWINGCPVYGHSKASIGIGKVTIENVTLMKGLNRFVITTDSNDEDIRLRPVFKDRNGDFLKTLKYQLTIDEVDPK